MPTNSIEKEQIDALRVEWKKLWSEKLNDKVRAEGIASSDYAKLFLDQGTIIHATRDFKVLNFKDILEQHQIANPDRYVPPDPSVGGWGSFIRKTISPHDKPARIKNVRAAIFKDEMEREKERQQGKKGGRGWLHV